MFDYVSLVLATACIGFMFIGVLGGNRYHSYVKDLDKGIYPMRGFYTIGFYLSRTRLFRLRGKLARDLKKQAAILYGEIYHEYFAALAWAQFISMSLLGVSVLLIFGALAGSTAAVFFILMSGLAVAAFWNLALSKMKETLAKRRDECVSEFPEMISKLSLLISTGMVLSDAWKHVARGKDGELYSLMRKTVEMIDNGESEISAIYRFGVLSDAPEIKKFSSAIIQGLEKGNVGLADFLTAQASELLAAKRQFLLQKGEIAAGKLIIPLAIMFIGIIMIIIVAAIQSMPF
jgi:tight adherence protein C